MGGLLNGMIRECRRRDFNSITCSKSVDNIFLYGGSLVRQLHMSRKRRKKGTWTAALHTWPIDLATPEQDALLWAGFYGNEGPTTKQNLLHFAHLTERQLVHPSTKLGQMIEANHELSSCTGKMGQWLAKNMWEFVSYAFVMGLRRRHQRKVVILVNKELDGDWRLQKSILFKQEVPALGVAAWGLDQAAWSPEILVIDLMGTCSRTSEMLRQQLFEGVPFWFQKGRLQSRIPRAAKRRLFVENPAYFALKENIKHLNKAGRKHEYRNIFASKAKLTWRCLDCAPPHCTMDERLAEHVRAGGRFRRLKRLFGAFRARKP